MTNAITATFAVSKRFKVEMSIDLASSRMEVHWLPDLPRRLKSSELETYRRARNHLMQKAADLPGQTIIIADLDGRMFVAAPSLCGTA